MKGTAEFKEKVSLFEGCRVFPIGLDLSVVQRGGQPFWGLHGEKK